MTRRDRMAAPLRRYAEGLRAVERRAGNHKVVDPAVERRARKAAYIRQAFERGAVTEEILYGYHGYRIGPYWIDGRSVAIDGWYAVSRDPDSWVETEVVNGALSAARSRD